MSDAANAIRKAFQKVFGTNTILIMCWFHVKKNVKDMVKSMLDKKQRAGQLWTDLHALHFAPSLKVFGAAVALFYAKLMGDKEQLSYLKLRSRPTAIGLLDPPCR